VSVKQFRKKPVVISAVQWTGENFEAVTEFLGDDFVGASRGPGFDEIVIQTLEGGITASLGDWVIRGVKGEHYPCKPDIFEATYEPVESPAVVVEHHPV
jgi:hypothetical protein